MNKRPLALSLIIGCISVFTQFGCTGIKSNVIKDAPTDNIMYSVSQNNFEIAFNNQLHSRISSSFNQEQLILGAFLPTEYVITSDGDKYDDFEIVSTNSQTIDSELGEGKQHIIIGLHESGLEKTLSISAYNNYPSMAFYKVGYRNTSGQAIKIAKWVNNHYQLMPASNSQGKADFWSYQGASYSDRRDWVSPLSQGFSQENYMGMNASDYGSGTAIVDVWRQDIGIAVGHSEITPKLVALPLSYENAKTGARLHVELSKTVDIAPGESINTLETFVNVHTNDYYNTLKNYRTAMADKGLKIDDIPDSAYEAIWCAWGYERDFSVEEVLASLDTAKEMGLSWAVLDDGWQTSEGDWYLHPDKFPEGDKDMQAFVSKIEEAGLKAKLWWAPLAVDPGTDLLHQHSDMLLLDEWGAVHDVTWWNSFLLCPAYAKTIENGTALVDKMMGTWGYKGLKIDGQHLNGVPPCYNPKHNHAYPEESTEKLGEFWQAIYETALKHDPEAVVEICPCGTSYAFHNLPFMNQVVSSDPLSSWQIRHKGKTLKGLMGESAPYYGDHVELSDKASDFASSVGIGAVVGTKFTLVGATGLDAEFILTPQKREEFAKWITIYNEKMLPKGTYLGELYDIGFDLPETHVIAKDNRLYFAFYADTWNDSVELRGLNGKTYKVVDYINNLELGEISGTTATLNVNFTDYLLIELTPIESQPAS